MGDEIESLVLEHLRHIRGRVDQIAEDMGDLKRRMSGLEQSMNLVKREINLSEETDARQQITLDKLAEHIGRIERHLELSLPKKIHRHSIFDRGQHSNAIQETRRVKVQT